MTTTASKSSIRGTALPKTPATTGIGSLPHHNIDAALAFSFQASIPFLPQIPIRNPWEFMIAQALEGMPGLLVEKDGAVGIDVDVWMGRGHVLDARLLKAFSSMAASSDAFESFEPSAATASGWQPFLWELEERGKKIAKIQIAGPLTAQWALKLSDGSNINKYPDLASQIYRLVLARALAMTRRLQKGGIQPIIYLDEPGLYGFTSADPRNALALQELKLMVRALRNEGSLVGLHCCSDTDWKAVLSLDLNIISIDTGLSLHSLLSNRAELTTFIANGGRLSLGVIPTSRPGEVSLQTLDVRGLFVGLVDTVAQAFADQPVLARKVMSEAIYTPACGLALHTTSDAEAALAALLEFGKLCEASLLQPAPQREV